MAQQQQQKSKRHKAKDQRPARSRYWNEVKLGNGLRRRKIRNLVECCGLTPQAAAKRWLETRQRIKK